LEEHLTNRQRKNQRNWNTKHGKKRVFPSRRAAVLEILRLWRDNREINLEMSWYWCTWGSAWQKGRSYPRHLHIGHDRVHVRRKQLLRWLNRNGYWKFKKIFVWSLFNLRTRLRNYLVTGSWERHVNNGDNHGTHLPAMRSSG
jgi:hypothetical protein